jgi:hypothetical protein
LLGAHVVAARRCLLTWIILIGISQRSILIEFRDNQQGIDESGRALLFMRLLVAEWPRWTPARLTSEVSTKQAASTSLQGMEDMWSLIFQVETLARFETLGDLIHSTSPLPLPLYSSAWFEVLSAAIAAKTTRVRFIHSAFSASLCTGSIRSNCPLVSGPTLLFACLQLSVRPPVSQHLVICGTRPASFVRTSGLTA